MSEHRPMTKFTDECICGNVWPCPVDLERQLAEAQGKLTDGMGKALEVELDLRAENARLQEQVCDLEESTEESMIATGLSLVKDKRDLKRKLRKAQGKLDVMEKQLRESNKLLHRYSKDGIHFNIEECGACQLLAILILPKEGE